MFGFHVLEGLLLCLSAAYSFKGPNARISARLTLEDGSQNFRRSILRETANSDNFLDYFQFKPSGELQKALGIGPHPPLSPPPEGIISNGKRVPYFLENDRDVLTSYVQEVADLIEAAKSEAHRDWSAMTVSQLKQELKDRGLSVSGVKRALVERLETSDKDRLQALANAESAIADAEAAMSIAHTNNDDETALRATGELREKIVKEFLDPLVSCEVEKGVASEAIKGAALFGATLGAIVSKNIPLAISVGIGAAYVSISPGTLGQVIRSIGMATWDTISGSLQFLQGIDRSGDLRRKISKSTASSFARLVEVAKESQRIAMESQATYVAEQELLETRLADSPLQVEASSAADTARLAAMEAAEATVNTIALQDVAEAAVAAERKAIEDARKADEEKRLAEIAAADGETEELRRAEEEQVAEAARVAEEDRRAAEAAAAAEKRAVEDARKAEEEKRLAEIAAAAAEAEELRRAEDERASEASRLAEEDRRVAEAQRAEQARLAEESRRIEAERLADELRKAEVARLEDEARLAQENLSKEAELAALESDTTLSEDDWKSSVRAAQQQIDGVLAGWDDDEAFDETEKARWQNAEQVASLLNSQAAPFSEEDEEVDYESLALAARAAVEEFEKQRQTAVDDSAAQRQMWSNDMIVEPQTEWSKLTVAKLREELSKRGLPTNGKKNDLVSRLQLHEVSPYESSELQDGEDLEYVANAARAAVEIFESSQQQDWNELTVAQLRNELKARGLLSTGKKAELVAALEASETEQQVINLDSDDSDLGFDIEDLGLAARQAVDIFNSVDDFDDEPSDEALWEIENGAGKLDVSYSSMSVAELKDELRSRGLSTSGRKADLVTRLEASD